MTQLARLLDEVRRLDPVERSELLAALLLSPSASEAEFQWFDRFPALEYPSIVSTPSVCGGSARLLRTRIPVWVLEQMRRLGVSEIEILRAFPTLRAADLVQAWSYASRHKAEIDLEIQANEED